FGVNELRSFRNQPVQGKMCGFVVFGTRTPHHGRCIGTSLFRRNRIAAGTFMEVATQRAFVNASLLGTVLRRVSPWAADAQIADAELLQRFALQRDESAFATLVQRHGPLVWTVCRNLLPVEADAEDAFQATFLALIRSAGAIRAPGSLGSW